MRARVASDPHPGEAPARVTPQLLMDPRRVVAQIHGFIEAVSEPLGIRRRTPATGITEITELADIALAAERAFDAHGDSVQIRLRSLPFLIEQVAGCEAVEAVSARHFLRLFAREQMGKAIAGGRRRLEPAVTPAAVEVQPLDRRAVDDR